MTFAYVYLFYVNIHECAILPWSAGSWVFAGWAETRTNDGKT
jgi:hypothetical protein